MFTVQGQGLTGILRYLRVMAAIMGEYTNVWISQGSQGPCRDIFGDHSNIGILWKIPALEFFSHSVSAVGIVTYAW